jgi:hypothetical protein
MIRAVRADGAVLKMLVVRYFGFVGAALLALLFVSNALLPKLPVADRTASAVDSPMIRIQSDRKWPERVVFDTRIPAVTLAQTAKAEPAVPVAAKVADASAKARVREAFAQLQPADPAQLQTAIVKLPQPKLQPKRKIAKIARKRLIPPTVLAAQQPMFGFFGNNTW